MISRREFLNGAAASSVAAPLQKRPNLVVLLTDDQRFDTVRAFGHPDVQTPNMDRLVREGTAFTQAMIMGGMVSAVCAPSRGMLLTGQSLFHVHDNLIDPNEFPGRLRRPYNFFPEELRKAGYHTHLVGKWHLGSDAARHINRCFDSAAAIFPNGMSDHDKVPYMDFDPTGKYPKSSLKVGNEFSSELFAGSAMQFLRSRQGQQQPFLLYVAFTAPHDPRMPPRRFAELYNPGKLRMPRNFMPEHPFDIGNLRIRDEVLAPHPRTEPIVRQHMADYYGMISEVDHEIGRVLDTLDQTGLRSNTVIVYAADNGLAVGQHGLMGKQNMYDHSIRIPLVFAGPGIPAGKKVNSLRYSIDVAPTLLEAAGVPIPNTVEGVSLWPEIHRRAQPPRDCVVAAHRHWMRALRTNEHKLIEYRVDGKRTTQLFNLRRDPWEMQNLAAEVRYTPLRKDMQKKLRQELRRIDEPLPEWISETASDL